MGLELVEVVAGEVDPVDRDHAAAVADPVRLHRVHPGVGELLGLDQVKAK